MQRNQYICRAQILPRSFKSGTRWTWLTQLTGYLVSTDIPTLGEQQVDREAGGPPVWRKGSFSAKLDWTEVLYFHSLVFSCCLTYLPDLPLFCLSDDTLPILQGPAWITPPPYQITIVKHHFSLSRTPMALGLKVSYRNFDLYSSCSCACHIYSTRLQSSWIQKW